MDIDIQAMQGLRTPLVNTTLLPMLLMSLASQRYTPRTTNTFKHEYDYIIVGAGAAGSVLANRLTEMPCVSVLLLEAGGPPPILTEVPGATRAFYDTEVDWKFRTTPQKYSGRGLRNRQVTWPTGKMIGGSSVLNAGVVVRGNRKNYDRWAAEGAKGWSYKDVLPYFKKLEDNRDPEYVKNGYHGVGGPQTVHRPRYEGEIKKPVADAAVSYGYKFVDPNGPSQVGFYDIQAYLRSGQRCSAAKGYLVPAENRTNLDIVPKAYVQKIIIKNNRAIGVKFDHEGSTHRVRARREVIMSAGSVNTPQLLMLSGIGPKKELARFKIPMVADLPVGKNLQDQPASFAVFLLSPTIQPVSVKLLNPLNIAQYIQNRTGPLGSPEFISILSFLRNNEIHPKVDFPDHQLYFVEAITELVLMIGVRPEVYAQTYLVAEGKPVMGCLSMVSNPRSRGTITLASDDPYEMPIIDPNYLEDPRDLKDIVQGLKNCMKIGNSPQMRRIGSTPLPTLLPGCEQYVGDEDRYLACQATTITMSTSNPVGTARMGDPRDPRTVVDPELRVKNVKGLRVVDASIIPVIPSGNIEIPVLMVAEKAADIIKKTINCHGHHHKDEHFDEDLYDDGHRESSWREDEDDSWKEKEHSRRPRKHRKQMDRLPKHKEPHHDDILLEDDDRSPWKDEEVEEIWE